MPRKTSKRSARAGVDRLGRAPLHYAAAEGDATRLEALLRGGADPNAQDDAGWAPLHFAAQARSGECARILLAAGATVDLRDRHGNTPLWRAVFSSLGDGSVIRLLRAAGSDARAANEHGVSPAQLARSIANYDVARFFTDVPEKGTC